MIVIEGVGISLRPFWVVLVEGFCWVIFIWLFYLLVTRQFDEDRDRDN